MSGRFALLIGNGKFKDQSILPLETPMNDIEALAKVLNNPLVGAFDEVLEFIDKPAHEIRREIGLFYSAKKADDLLLLYFSGHGMQDEIGRLFLVVEDTERKLLRHTAIAANSITDDMDLCRSKRQVLILDCCYSGAFEKRGTKGRADPVTESTFEGNGYGRVVLTASSSTQIALQGKEVLEDSKLSLFTHYLVEGLRTGQAAKNNERRITLSGLYEYVYSNVLSRNRSQEPHIWTYGGKDEIIIALNPAPVAPQNLLHSGKIKVLFLGANPSDTNRLRLDTESRNIRQTLFQSKFGEHFDYRQDLGIRLADIQDILVSYRPNIVHLSGHGTTSGKVILEDTHGKSSLVSVNNLSKLFSALRGDVQCVILNIAYSEKLAVSMAEYVDCVVGLSDTISDEAAISFGVAFYQAIGFGRNVETAFKIGCNQLQLMGFEEENPYKLIAVNGEPGKVVFVKNDEQSVDSQIVESTKILILGVNTGNSSRFDLRLDEEARVINTALGRARYSKFTLQVGKAVSTTDLQDTLLQHKPDIIHIFSDSTSDEISLADGVGNRHPVSAREISQLFSELKGDIRCVVLNNCYSEPQALAIAKNVDCVIGIARDAGDRASFDFINAFYHALSCALDVKTAFDLGSAQIDLEDLNEQDMLRLIAIKNNPENITFVNEDQAGYFSN